MTWFPALNRASKWCACHRDGTMDECADHADALRQCDMNNAQDARAEDAYTDQIAIDSQIILTPGSIP